MPNKKVLYILKCGCIAGAVWSFFQILLVIGVNEIGLLSRTGIKQMIGNRLFVLDILSGILALAFYALVRMAIDSIPRAMSTTVVAWFTILCLANLFINGTGFTSSEAWLLSLLALISISLSLLAGVVPYELITDAESKSADKKAGPTTKSTHASGTTSATSATSATQISVRTKSLA